MNAVLIISAVFFCVHMGRLNVEIKHNFNKISYKFYSYLSEK